MKPTTRICILTIIAIAAISCAALAESGLDCRVTTYASCTDTKVLGMYLVGQGGTHAANPLSSSPFVVCCTGIDGVETAPVSEGSMVALSAETDAHAGISDGSLYLKITGSADLQCAYMQSGCGSATCLFSISGISDAHVSDCGNYAFPIKYCCTAGALEGEPVNATELVASSEAPQEHPAATTEQKPQKKSLLARLRIKLAALGRIL